MIIKRNIKIYSVSQLLSRKTQLLTKSIMKQLFKPLFVGRHAVHVKTLLDQYLFLITIYGFLIKVDLEMQFWSNQWTRK